MEQDPKEDEFRDSLSTVDEEGKRIWVYPKKPKGKYTTWRTILAGLLLAVLFGGPFVRIGGQPLLLLDILNRKFVVFGQIFWPKDFFFFAILLITLVVGVVLFTVVFGRIFCGWICPQTIFMEMVFRKIEYFIEGDYNKQRALDRGPWTGEKIFKKTSKHIIFFAISFLIGNTFLAYLIGTEELFKIMTDPPSQHIAGLAMMLGFSFVFYFVFAWFREQVCTTICPYGRLQGVMLDKDSVVVAYDRLRGEPRGKFRKGENRDEVNKGDCIDCKQCVYVCPTGIDIRHGTQLECVNCTACIDACDEMMEKVGLPTGLVRYDSENAIENRTSWRFTNRMKAYVGVLVLLVGLASAIIATRSIVDAVILRTPGKLYNKEENGTYSNLYNYTLVNNSNEELEIEIQLEGKGEMKMIGGTNEVKVPPGGTKEGTMFIYLSPEELDGMKTEVNWGIYAKGEVVEKVKSNFVGPI